MSSFRQARHYHPGRSRKGERVVPIRVIVWHDMEAPESSTTAESVARYFANLGASPKASAHVCVDSDSTVDCVRLRDTAFAAPGANADGVQIELAGYARQTAAQWADAYSDATLRQAAAWIARQPELHSIPDRWLTDAQLRDGRTEGHATHAQVSRVFRPSDHTDPGRYFPLSHTMHLVSTARRARRGDSTTQEGYTMPPTIGEGTDKRGAVRRLRGLLMAAGHVLTEGVDGAFGPGLKMQVQAFQRNTGLQADGVVGPTTWRTLIEGVGPSA